MKSSRPKVLHRVAGRPMIEYVLRAAESLSPTTTTLVVGHMKETLQQGLSAWPGLRFVVQEPQLGTGHALLQAAPGPGARKGRRVVAFRRRTVAAPPHPGRAARAARSRRRGRHSAHRGGRSAIRLRPHRAHEREDCANRRRARRVAGAAEDQGNQQRNFRVLAGPALRRAARAGRQQRAGGVLSDGPRVDFPASEARRGNGGARGSQRDSRHQQPVRAGGSEQNRETDKKTTS